MTEIQWLTEAPKFKKNIWDFYNLQKASAVILYLFVGQIKWVCGPN